MTTKEMYVEIDNLQRKINDMRQSINKAVYNYLEKHIGIASANSEASDDLVGKVVAEEWHCYWDRSMDTVAISYCVFKNKWGDFSDEKEIAVDFATIDKYYQS